MLCFVAEILKFNNLVTIITGFSAVLLFYCSILSSHLSLRFLITSTLFVLYLTFLYLHIPIFLSFFYHVCAVVGGITSCIYDQSIKSVLYFILHENKNLSCQLQRPGGFVKMPGFNSLMAYPPTCTRY